MTIDVPGIPTSFLPVSALSGRVRIFLRGSVLETIETTGDYLVRTTDRRDDYGPPQVVLEVYGPTGPEGAHGQRLRYRLWPEMIDRIEYEIQRDDPPPAPVDPDPVSALVAWFRRRRRR